MSTILIIEDDKAILKGTADFLKREHFTVSMAETGAEGLADANKEKPDLILLDLRLPDLDGYDVCRQLKNNPETEGIPIIIVSTRSEATEKVVGLEMGADDYLTKPFNSFELLARIRARLRHKKSRLLSNITPTGVLSYKELTLNDELRKVTVGNKIVKLSPKEYDLLKLLLSKPGKPFSRNTIMASIWGDSYNSLHGTVDAHIKTLRKKLGTAAQYIETISGIGYRWLENDSQ